MTDQTAEAVPPITCVEPVYPSVDSDQSFWVSCEAEWDADRRVFLNREASEGWILDEHAFLDAVYIVEGEEYSSMEDAMRAALGDDRYEAADPMIRVAPDEDYQPEWGPEA